MEFENDNEDQKAADESAGRSVSDVLTEEEEIRTWKREGFGELPMTLSVPDVGHYLGVSRSAAYKLREDGTIRALKFGRSYRVPRRELFRLLDLPEPPPTRA